MSRTERRPPEQRRKHLQINCGCVGYRCQRYWHRERQRTRIALRRGIEASPSRPRNDAYWQVW